MTRADVLRDLLGNGSGYDEPRLEAVAAELELPLADVLVVGGHPVPGRLLPPARDRMVMYTFTYQATFCDHEQLVALTDFLRAMPDEHMAPASRPARDLTDPEPFGAVLDGLMTNRGFPRAREFPFVGLSRTTIRGMIGGDWHTLRQLEAVAGPLGWRMEDLAVLAGEPVVPLERRPTFCRHLGAVFLAAVPRTTEQLTFAAEEADRLSDREDQSPFRPVAEGTTGCPDE